MKREKIQMQRQVERTSEKGLLGWRLTTSFLKRDRSLQEVETPWSLTWRLSTFFLKRDHSLQEVK